MIDVGSGAYPVLADYNGGWAVGLFVSNYSYYIYSYYDQYMFAFGVLFCHCTFPEFREQYRAGVQPGDP
ncbi:MAG: hypothetical protein R2759_19535 [Bacteroidales bacterium]